LRHGHKQVHNSWWDYLWKTTVAQYQSRYMNTKHWEYFFVISSQILSHKLKH
jgi:hypothetical protein